MNVDLKEYCPHQEGTISQVCQRPDISYIQELHELQYQVNTNKMLQQFFLMQAYLDRILKMKLKKL